MSNSAVGCRKFGNSCSHVSRAVGFHRIPVILLVVGLALYRPTGVYAQAPTVSYTSPQVYVTNNAISNLSPTASNVPAQTFRNVTTYAGSGTGGGTNNDNPLSATFNDIKSVVMDRHGNMYVAERNDGRIRKIAASVGTVTTLVDWSDFQPQALAINSSTGDLYISIATNRILKVPNANSANYATQAPNYSDWTNATIVWLGQSNSGSANGTGTTATFNNPTGMCVDGDNQFLYVADYGNDRIRKVTISSGAVATVSASGTPVAINDPEDLVVDGSGNLYVTSATNKKVHRITSSGTLSDFAGSGTAGYLDGQGTAARLSDPRGIDMDAAGNLYVADGSGSHAIRKITSAGYVSTLVGSGTGLSGNTEGVGSSARFNVPWDVIVDRTNSLLFVGDIDNDKVRKVDIGGYTVWPPLPIGLSLSPTTGVISGTPTVRGRQVYYSDDFNDADGGSNSSLPTTSNSASYTGGWVRLTDAVDWQSGGFQVNASNVNSTALQVDFTLITSKTNGADGLSYNFSWDGAITGGSEVQMGTGSGLSLSFITYSSNTQSVRLYYGARSNIGTTTIGSNGLLAVNTSNNSLWLGKTAEVSLSVDNDGKATLRINGTDIFTNVQLPAAYASADKSSWKHIFRAATGGFNDLHAIDNLVIRQSLGAADHTVTAFNATGSASSTLNINVADLPTVASTTAVSSITSTTASSGGSTLTDGGSAITAKGVVWGTGSNPTVALATKTNDGSGTANFTSSLTGLTSNTTYYVRAYATTAAGTAYGNEVSFTTTQASPNISYSPSTVTVYTGGAITPITLTNTGGTPDKIQVSTLAGRGTFGSANGTGTAAGFNSPNGVAVDGSGNVYVADANNVRIRNITPEGVVNTLAGSVLGFANGTGTAASFNIPTGVAVDGSGNVYVADQNNHLIRKITQNGEVSTLAGSGSSGFLDQSTPGNALSARFNFPSGVAVDGSGNVYVADKNNNRIRKITPAGVVSTLAGSSSPGSTDGSVTEASFKNPYGVAVDGSGNVYVADQFNHRIRKITPAGVVNTLAGSSNPGSTDGNGDAASFNYPTGVAVDGSGNVYVADQQNHRIRKITPAGAVSTLAGSSSPGSTDATGTAARFYSPSGVAVDGSGNVYVADRLNFRIRIISSYRIEPALPAGLFFDSRTGTISGTPTTAQAAKVYTVYSRNAGGSTSATIALTVAGPPTVATAAATSVTATSATLNGTVNANGTATTALTFTYSPNSDLSGGTTINSTPTSVSGNTVTPVSAAITGLTASTAYYFRFSATNPAGTTNGTTLSFTTAAPPPNISYGGSPITLSVGTAMSTLTPVSSGGTPEPMQVSTLAGSVSGFANGAGTAARFQFPSGVAVDGSGNVYVADANNVRIRKITPAGVVSTLAGSGVYGFEDGTGTAARFQFPYGVAVDGSGNVYVADRNNHLIRKITPAGVVSTLAGSGVYGFEDGTGTAARFQFPSGVAVDGSGNVYVADKNNHRIRKITPAGVVSTLAGSSSPGSTDGTGTAASFKNPYGVAVDGSGNVYVGDDENHRIRRITPEGVVSTLAGSRGGFADGTGTAASFANPRGVAVDGSGNVYVADQQNNRIRKITVAGVVSTLAGSARSGSNDGTGIAAGFFLPNGVAVDGSGNLYVADGSNNRIRKISNYSISPALPTGLSFNTATGVITGTPTALSAATTYTVTASNAGGPSTATFSLAVSSSLLTADVTSIGETTATGGGTVGTFSGITERGVVYSTTAGPDITDGTDTKLADGSATTGTITSNLTSLTPNTTYYIRSYVIHSGGTAYGSEKSFKTNALGTFPDITKIFGDAKFSLTAPTAVSTGAFSYGSSNTGVATISGSEVTIVGAGSTTITATQAAAGAYASIQKTLTLTVNKATPTIVFTIPTSTPLNTANNLSIIATSSNSQPVTIVIGAGTASGTINGTPGNYTLSGVSSTGDIIFNASTFETSTHAAGSKSVTMNVEKNNQTITFGTPTPVTYSNGLTQSLSATTDASGLSVTDFSVVSGPGDVPAGTTTLNITGTGNIVIRARQDGNASYNPAPNVERTLVVNPGVPSITGFTPTSATTGDVVTITGQHFENVSAVSFGGTAATSFTVVNSTSITAAVGAGASGSVSVTTTGGTDTEAGFRYRVTWTGATNAFNSTGNWSGGRVPQTDDDIVFSATAASDLELDGNKTVGHVNFNGSGRSLKLGAHNLTIKGNLTMPGNIAGTGRVIMAGESAQTIIGGGSIPDLEINNSTGVSIDAAGDELLVSGTLRSTAGTLTTNGKLRLSSNSGGTARVGVVTGAITGNVIAERYVQQNQNSGGTGRAWRLVSVPVTGTGNLRDFFMNGRNGQDLTLSASRDAETENSGTPIVGHNYATASEATTAGFDWIGVANQVSSLRSYVGDAGGGSFASENVPDLDATTYSTAAQGYMVFTRGDRKLDFPSTDNSSATTFRSTGTLKTGDQSVTVQPAATSKYTLVGNPYMSVLDLSALYASNTTAIEPSFWIWDANIAGTFYQGAYVNVYKSGDQWVTNTGSYINPERIESGMAFFVEPLTTLTGTATLTITESHKHSADAAGLSPFSTDKSDDHGRVYLRLERADAKGQRQIIDGLMADFHKDFKESLGDRSDREKLRNGISRGSLWMSRENRVLSGQGLPWPKAEERSTVPVYMSGVGDQTLVLRVDPRGMDRNYVKGWLRDRVLKRETELDMTKPTDYDFIGTGSASWDSTRFELVFTEAGRPTTGGTALEPGGGSGSPSVRLYPNPSRSTDVKLSLRSMPAGDYRVQVLDMSGRLVANARFTHRGTNGEYRVLEGRRLSPGKYIVRLIDGKGGMQVLQMASE